MFEFPKMSLNAIRINAGMSQRKAANELGITPETLRSYEKGKTSPTIEMICKMEKLYQFPKDYIFLPSSSL